MQTSCLMPVCALRLAYKVLGFLLAKSAMLRTPMFQRSREQAFPIPGIIWSSLSTFDFSGEGSLTLSKSLAALIMVIKLTLSFGHQLWHFLQKLFCHSLPHYSLRFRIKM